MNRTNENKIKEKSPKRATFVVWIIQKASIQEFFSDFM
jgi:hypothetical protein